MRNIIIKNRNDEHFQGTYYGQPYKINLKTNKDELSMLTDDEVVEVRNSLIEQSKENPFLLINKGSVIRVFVKDGHIISKYKLKVQRIEDEGADDNGNYYCVALGVGVTVEDEELAEEYTHMVDGTNFDVIVA